MINKRTKTEEGGKENKVENQAVSTGAKAKEFMPGVQVETLTNEEKSDGKFRCHAGEHFVPFNRIEKGNSRTSSKPGMVTTSRCNDCRVAQVHERKKANETKHEEEKRKKREEEFKNLQQKLAASTKFESSVDTSLLTEGQKKNGEFMCTAGGHFVNFGLIGKFTKEKKGANGEKVKVRSTTLRCAECASAAQKANRKKTEAAKTATSDEGADEDGEDHDGDEKNLKEEIEEEGGTPVVTAATSTKKQRVISENGKLQRRRHFEKMEILIKNTPPDGKFDKNVKIRMLSAEQQQNAQFLCAGKHSETGEPHHVKLELIVLRRDEDGDDHTEYICKPCVSRRDAKKKARKLGTKPVFVEYKPRANAETLEYRPELDRVRVAVERAAQYQSSSEEEEEEDLGDEDTGEQEDSEDEEENKLPAFIRMKALMEANDKERTERGHKIYRRRMRKLARFVEEMGTGEFCRSIKIDLLSDEQKKNGKFLCKGRYSEPPVQHFVPFGDIALNRDRDGDQCTRADCKTCCTIYEATTSKLEGREQIVRNKYLAARGRTITHGYQPIMSFEEFFALAVDTFTVETDRGLFVFPMAYQNSRYNTASPERIVDDGNTGYTTGNVVFIPYYLNQTYSFKSDMFKFVATVQERCLLDLIQEEMKFGIRLPSISLFTDQKVVAHPKLDYSLVHKRATSCKSSSIFRSREVRKDGRSVRVTRAWPSYTTNDEINYKLVCDVVMKLLCFQGFRCAYSFFPLSFGNNNPFMISIERIDNEGDYDIIFDEDEKIVSSNIVVICHGFNSAALERVDINEMRASLLVNDEYLNKMEPTFKREREHFMRKYLQIGDSTQIPEKWQRAMEHNTEFLRRIVL